MNRIGILILASVLIAPLAVAQDVSQDGPLNDGAQRHGGPRTGFGGGTRILCGQVTAIQGNSLTVQDQDGNSWT